MNTSSVVNIRWLGKQEYQACWQRMQEFTKNRQEDTVDEIWLLEHEPVFTQGQNGKAEHLLKKGEIPVVQTDRGGQITYHGPGQLMVYTLIDIKRKQFNVRQFVSLLEQAIINLLAEFQIEAYAKLDAPGVYIKSNTSDLSVIDKKICSIGLRVRKGFAYHGIAFNVHMDLTPFDYINPCGFSNLKMTHFSELGGLTTPLLAGQHLIPYLLDGLRYTTAKQVDSLRNEAK
jgi:lipoyl(octanoyl) transferase